MVSFTPVCNSEIIIQPTVFSTGRKFGFAMLKFIVNNFKYFFFSSIVTLLQPRSVLCLLYFYKPCEARSTEAGCCPINIYFCSFALAASGCFPGNNILEFALRYVLKYCTYFEWLQRTINFFFYTSLSTWRAELMPKPKPIIEFEHHQPSASILYVCSAPSPLHN